MSGKNGAIPEISESVAISVVVEHVEERIIGVPIRAVDNKYSVNVVYSKSYL